IQYVGAIFLPLNPRLSAYEQAFQLEDASVSLLIYSPSLMDEQKHSQLTAANVNMIEMNTLQQMDLPSGQVEDELATFIDLDDIQTIMYTSGTTGTPKGVLISANNHWTSAIGSALNLGLSEDDCWLLAV